MKRFVFALLWFCGNAAFAQLPVQSNCIGPDSLYRTDAQRLALRYTFHAHSLDTANGAINSQLTQRIQNALNGLYHAAGLPQRDTVIDGLHIHTFPNPTMTSLDMEIDTSYAWANNLFHEILPTGNATVDAIMQSYGLTIDDVQDFGQFGIFVVFNADSNYNLTAVNHQLMTVPGVTVAELNGACCDGSDILLDTVTNDRVTFTWKYGGGDCPAGCTVLRFWRFTVTTNCVVSFDTVFGSQLDIPVVFDGIHQGVEPNAPELAYRASFLSCRATPGSRLEIVDVDGRLVKRETLSNDYAQVDLLQLASGIYIASVVTPAGLKQRLKFNKR